MKQAQAKIIALAVGAIGVCALVAIALALKFEAPETPFDRYVQTWDACATKNEGTRLKQCNEVAERAAEGR